MAFHSAANGAGSLKFYRTLLAPAENYDGAPDINKLTAPQDVLNCIYYFPAGH